VLKIKFFLRIFKFGGTTALITIYSLLSWILKLKKYVKESDRLTDEY